MSETAAVTNWFEIPVSDMARAAQFYEQMLDTKLVTLEVPEMQVRAFPDGTGKLGGALVQSAHNQPSSTGALIYFNGGADLSPMLARVEAAGGQVIVPKTDIGEFGHMAQFIDSEGNRIALHNY